MDRAEPIELSEPTDTALNADATVPALRAENHPKTDAYERDEYADAIAWLLR
ncbi:hypothetical protein GCM10027024_02680 [Microbacterium insulae]